MEYLEELYKLSEKAYKHNEVPVGALIVYKNKIIAKSYNKRIKKHDVTSHAEINVIRKAEKYMRDWRLTECDLYVTLRPCEMCMSVIKESRIKNVYYLLDRIEQQSKYNKTNICLLNNNKELAKKYKKLLSNFFKIKCNR